MSEAPASVATASVTSTWSAMFELAKPRLSALVLFTTLIGFLVASRGPIDLAVLFHVLSGTALVAAGANALNQIIERDQDALMVRTRNRPLPSGRLTPLVALRFAVVLSLAGLAQLFWGVNLLTAFLGALALLSYAFIYTPLKRVTVANTVVGAVVGGIPPIMGWAAARNELGSGAWALFAILFIWQFPHFFSIAWIYREDYLRGGFRMISVADETGRLTARQVAILSAILVPVSLLPVVLGMAGSRYALAALVLGVAFLGTCVWLSPSRRLSSARVSFIGSIAYLPALLIVLILDKM